MTTDNTETITEATVPFTLAAKKFFVFLPGTGISAFAAEMKKLSAKDREELRSMLAEATGENVVMPQTEGT